MIRVWDPLVRIFHWSLVALVISNAFFNEGGGDWHEWLGYAACAWIALRLVWGVVGTKHARFSEMRKAWPRRGQFVPHVRDYLRGRTPRILNHSPLALIGMAAMLACVLLLGLSGWMMSWDRFFGEEWLEETHEVLSNALLGLIVIHVTGVIRESLLHRENLVASMLHGRKSDLER